MNEIQDTESNVDALEGLNPQTSTYKCVLVSSQKTETIRKIQQLVFLVKSRSNLGKKCVIRGL